MRILFVSPVPTDAGGAGNRARIATLVEAVKSWGHEMHFAYVPMEPADRGAMEARFGQGRLHWLDYVPIRESIAVQWLRRFGRLVRIDAAFMHRLDDWYQSGIDAQLRDLHQRLRFDVVCVEYVFMSKALEAFPSDVLKLLDTHDCFGMRHRRYLAAGKKPQWFSTSLEDEERGFMRANVVMAIQSDEARQFRERLASSCNCEVVEVGHFLEEVAAVTPASSPRAVFVGSDNPINSSAIDTFMARVFPLIRKEIPDFQLLLAGGVCKVVKDYPGQVKLGFVNELPDAFAQAAVNVNPVLMGTGINIKLLDAMAYGMPCVTTVTGVRGLEQFGNEALWVIQDEDYAGFAHAVSALIANASLRERYGNAARAAAIQWNVSQQANLRTLLSRTPS